MTGANVQDRIRVIYLPFGPRGSGFQIATPMICVTPDLHNFIVGAKIAPYIAASNTRARPSMSVKPPCTDGHSAEAHMATKSSPRPTQRAVRALRSPAPFLTLRLLAPAAVGGRGVRKSARHRSGQPGGSLPLGGERRGEQHRTRASEERAAVDHWVPAAGCLRFRAGRGAALSGRVHGGALLTGWAEFSRAGC